MSRLVPYAGKARHGSGVGVHANDACLEFTAAMLAAGISIGGAGCMTNADRRRLMAAIPDDARDLTGRILGDPLPGRSALDQRQPQGTSA